MNFLVESRAAKSWHSKCCPTMREILSSQSATSPLQDTAVNPYQCDLQGSARKERHHAHLNPPARSTSAPHLPL